MKIEVVKEFTFDAAHRLPNHPGKCKNIHGHTYKLQIGVKGEIDERIGMVVDFGEMKELFEQFIISRLDHQLLNQIPDTKFPRSLPKFPKECPTAERMVVWIVNFLKAALISPQFSLSFVRLYETPTSYAEWRSQETATVTE